jgi:hypothetical protein
MFTNPTKKGGYGTPNTTIGAQHASLPEPYLVSRELDKVERKLARARVPKPFIGGAKGGIQDDNVFAYEPGAWAEPVKKRGAAEGGPKPFRPPGQDKRAHVPKYIPDPQDEKDKIRLDASKVLRGRTAGAYTRPLFSST